MFVKSERHSRPSEPTPSRPEGTRESPLEGEPRTSSFLRDPSRRESEGPESKSKKNCGEGEGPESKNQKRLGAFVDVVQVTSQTEFGQQMRSSELPAYLSLNRLFNGCFVSDRRTDRQADTPSYRDARTHLKSMGPNFCSCS